MGTEVQNVNGNSALIREQIYTWWRNGMETFSAIQALGEGNSPVNLKTFLRKVDKCITRIHNYWWHNHNKQSTTKTCTLFHWINCTCMSCINCATVLYQITESDRALTSSATVALKTIWFQCEMKQCYRFTHGLYPKLFSQIKFCLYQYA